MKFLKVIPYLSGGILIWGFGFADLADTREELGVKEAVVYIALITFIFSCSSWGGGYGGSCGD